jgi:probable HAF family extracellular repeat protein
MQLKKPVMTALVTLVVTATAFVAFGLLMQVRAHAQQTARHTHYHIIELSTLGGTFTQPGGINDRGEIEGWSELAGDNVQHAFLLSHGRLIDIPALGGPNSVAGWAPSNSGRVGAAGDTAIPDPLGEDFCGFGTHLMCQPFFWKDGKITRLPLPGGHNAVVNTVNNRDEGVGKGQKSIIDPDCGGQVLQTQGVIWVGNRVEFVLPNFPGAHQGSGHSLNDMGQAVGWSGNCHPDRFDTHAMLWDRGKPIDLGTIAGSNNQAFDINNHSQIVGFSGTADASFIHGFVWEKGKMQDIGTLPGDTFSFAVGNNDNGQVVGISVDSIGNSRGFIWENGTMRDINSLIPIDSPLIVIEADDLNVLGQIIGLVFNTENGQVQGFVANPVSEDDIDATVLTPLDLGAEGRLSPVILPEHVRSMMLQRVRSGSRLGR